LCRRLVDRGLLDPAIQDDSGIGSSTDPTVKSLNFSSSKSNIRIKRIKKEQTRTLLFDNLRIIVICGKNGNLSKQSIKIVVFSQRELCLHGVVAAEHASNLV
jgi:hypothetical protein